VKKISLVLAFLCAFGFGLEIYAFADSGAAVVAPATTGSGSGSQVAPADQLHDPVVDPTAAFNDAMAMKKIGWPLALLASLIMLARGVQSAAKRWPDVKAVAWLGSGSRAFAIAGALTIGAAAFNVLAKGGTWYAVAIAAAGALFALLAPAPKPAGP